MARDWYTPSELAELQATNPCPFWQRMNPTGWCVEKWWAGPMTSLANGIALALGMGVLGGVLVYAARIELLKPVVKLFSRPDSQLAAANRKRKWRTRRRRRAGR